MSGDICFAMNGVVVALPLLAILLLSFTPAEGRDVDTEPAERPTLATEMSRAVGDCSFPESGGNRSYADAYNASHSQPPAPRSSPAAQRRQDSERSTSTARPRARGGDHPPSRDVDDRPTAWREHFFLKTVGGGERRERGGWRPRDKRTTYDSRSNNLAACVVQCVFTRLDVVDEMGYVTEGRMISLLENYVIDRTERLAKTKRVVACFRKLGSAVEDDHCAHARKLALCFSLDMNQRPQQHKNVTRQH